MFPSITYEEKSSNKKAETVINLIQAESVANPDRNIADLTPQKNHIYSKLNDRKF